MGITRPASRIRPKQSLYIMGYYPSYRQFSLTPSSIDYSCLTHVMHFAKKPENDGTLNATALDMTPTNSTAAVAAAHNAGKKILLVVGGGGFHTNFQAATSTPALRTTFVNNIVSYCNTHNYDGVDINWEQLSGADIAPYGAFMQELRSQLPAHKMITLTFEGLATVPASTSGIVTFSQYFDLCNLQTYGLMSAFSGWPVWHNQAIYSGGAVNSIGNELTCADLTLRNFAAGGTPRSKLGIGSMFLGKRWVGGTGTPTGGATAPKQFWSTAPAVTGDIRYSTVLSTYYTAARYRWDQDAHAPYLTEDLAGSTSDWFLTYEDETSIRERVAFCARFHVPSIILWELDGGWLSANPAGQQWPLLQAYKDAKAAFGLV